MLKRRVFVRFESLSKENEVPDDLYMEKLITNKFKYDKKQAYATWIVSNCGSTGGARARLEEAKNLRKAGMRFDGYGKCWANDTHHETIYPQSEIDRSLRWRGDTDSAIAMISKYRFYMAFENGLHCTDYLSEKFWRNSLEAELVPIVFGVHPDDIKKLAPPNSYIHVEDYPDRVGCPLFGTGIYKRSC